jgi:hypothetical protein
MRSAFSSSRSRFRDLVQGVWRDAEVFHLLSYSCTDVQAPAQGAAHLHSLGELLEAAVGPLGAQLFVRDDAGAAGAGVGFHAEHGPDLVVLEAGGEDVARALLR